MRAKLISREHGEFAIEETATIGRAAACTVVLEATVVSNEHARIRFVEERSAYIVEDLGSLNGTFLDGVRLDRQEVLGSLHVIQFGDGVDFIFQLVDVDPGEPATEGKGEDGTVGLPASGKTQVGGEAPVLPAPLREGGVESAESAKSEDAGRTRVEQDVVPVPEILAEAGEAVRARAVAGSGFALEFLLGDRSQRFSLKVGANVVGRSKTADIRIDFPDLSRRHATLTVSESSVTAIDEGSRNHTFVNGEQIEAQVALPVGAQIVFGRLEARLISTATEAEETVDRSGDPGKNDPS